MRIAILTCGLLPIPAVQGGAVENLIDFYLECNDRKRLHEFTVYSPWHLEAVKAAGGRSGVNHYIYINVSSLWARTRRWLYGRSHSGEYYNHFIEYYFERVYADLRQRDYDVILLENCPGYACKLAQRGCRNLVLHLHNDLLNAQSRRHDEVSGSLTKIITVSDFVRQRVATIAPAAKIQTVLNGIDLSTFSPKATPAIGREQMGFSATDFVMVYSGRINKDKGVSELIDALLLLKDYPQVKLMILGSTFFSNAGIEDAFVRSLRDKCECIRERIVFTGFIPYGRVAGYLQMADVAVLPSMWEEPFGLTVVEAMAVGLPLVTTRSGGIPEICEGVATIVERDGIVGHLAAAIVDLIEHPEKRRLMAAASLRRASRFSKEHFSEDFLAAVSCRPPSAGTSS